MPYKRRTKRSGKGYRQNSVVYTNTTVTSLEAKTNSGQPTSLVSYEIRDLLKGSGEMNRRVKLISIGVQAIPDPDRNKISSTLLQIGISGKFASSDLSYVAHKPPLLLSLVNPTYLQFRPDSFQKQPFNMFDPGNLFSIKLRAVDSALAPAVQRIGLIITIKVALLPQTEFEQLVPV